MVPTIAVLVTLVIHQITAISRIPQFHHALQKDLRTGQQSRPSMRIIAAWKRMVQPESFRNDINKKAHQTNASSTAINATEPVSVSTESGLSWMDHAMKRVVYVITYAAFGQSLFHLLNANRSEIATEVRCRFSSCHGRTISLFFHSCPHRVRTIFGYRNQFVAGQ